MLDHAGDLRLVKHPRQPVTRVRRDPSLLVDLLCAPLLCAGATA